MNKELIIKISNVLKELGIPANLRGYAYIRDAVVLGVDDPQIIYEVTSKLYPKIARMNNTTPTRVERAIRHAIEVAFIVEILSYSINILDSVLVLQEVKQLIQNLLQPSLIELF